MCGTCGCGNDAAVTLTSMQSGAQQALRVGHVHSHDHDHDHHHDHDHGHAHAHAHAHDHDHDHTHAAASRTVVLEQEILAKNAALAQWNQGWLAGRGVRALNLVSSPGAGKTALLERTLRDLGGQPPIHVIEGDQATLNDAQRIRAAGARVVQINTGSGCHLEADMVARALQELEPEQGSLVLIENVGNLVCPALFDLGEEAKVAILSVTEGEDKPLKYPHMFQAADYVVLNKIDLLPYLDYDKQAVLDNLAAVNPRARVFEVSATKGDGLEAWYAWLHEIVAVGSGQPQGAPA